MKKLIKKVWLYFYNKKNHTRICSIKASLKATYAEGVGVEPGTTICHDVTLGYMSYVNANSWIESCDIGNYCSISSSVMIGPTEHYVDKMLSHPISGTHPVKRVKIGNDVLISHGVTILQGITIGDGAIIGAGAVVTKDVLPFTVVGGVPAKVIRKRFNSEQINYIYKSNLYNLKTEEVKKLLKEFKN